MRLLAIQRPTGTEKKPVAHDVSGHNSFGRISDPVATTLRNPVTAWLAYDLKHFLKIPTGTVNRNDAIQAIVSGRDEQR